MAFEIEHGRGFTAEELAEAHAAATGKSNKGTIAEKTLRMHPYRDYAALILDGHMLGNAAAGTLRYREFAAGVSFEPRPMLPALRAGERRPGMQARVMAEAIAILGPDWSEDIGKPVRLVR